MMLYFSHWTGAGVTTWAQLLAWLLSLLTRALSFSFSVPSMKPWHARPSRVGEPSSRSSSWLKTDLSRISNESTPPIYLFSHSKTFSNELLQISDPLETKKLPRGLLVPDFPFLSSKTWQNPGTKISPRIRIILCQIFKIASVQQK